MPGKLRLHFSKAFNGDVWEQSLWENFLLVTERDQEGMQVSFSLIDLKTGGAVFEGLSFEESWWIGAYHFFAEVVVFQVFEDSQNIEARSYFAFDVHTHEALWSLGQVMAVGRRDKFVQLRSREAGDALFWIDITTGETLGTIPDEISTSTISHDAVFPLHYVEESSHFRTVSAFLKNRLNVESFGAIDYLECSGLVLVGYHLKNGSKVSFNLLVLNEHGVELMHRELDGELDGLSSGAFFIAGEQLIFVVGRKLVESYLIG